MSARIEIVFSTPMVDPRVCDADVETFERTYRHQLLEGGNLEDIISDLLRNEQVDIRFVYDQNDPESGVARRAREVADAGANLQAFVDWLMASPDHNGAFAKYHFPVLVKQARSLLNGI